MLVGSQGRAPIHESLEIDIPNNPPQWLSVFEWVGRMADEEIGVELCRCSIGVLEYLIRRADFGNTVSKSPKAVPSSDGLQLFIQSEGIFPCCRIISKTGWVYLRKLTQSFPSVAYGSVKEFQQFA